MLCARCKYELKPTDMVCPNCGTAVERNVMGFENTLTIKKILRSICEQYGEELFQDANKFISILNDHIPDYEKERRLIRNVVQSGVIRCLLAESNHEMGIMKAKEYMINEMFLSENATEFILVCFTGMLGWGYIPQAEQQDTQEEASAAPVSQEQTAPAAPAENVMFRVSDAGRFKFRGNVKIPEGFTSLECFCFDGFSFMRSVRLPESMILIGEYAFSECKRLKTIELPAGLKVIHQGAFSSCKRLTMVKIPNGVSEIEDSTFSFCSNLEIVEIPASVSSIGSEAFSGCEKLKKLFIPDSVKYIESDAFMLCPNLTIRCYENSYVHKFCLAYGLKTDVIVKTAFQW